MSARDICHGRASANPGARLFKTLSISGLEV